MSRRRHVGRHRPGSSAAPHSPTPASASADGPPETTTSDLASVAVRGTAWLGLVNLIAKGAQVLVTLAFAHFLTPGDLGLVSITAAVLNFAGLIQTMGLFDVVARTKSDPHTLAGTLVTLATSVGAVLALGGFLLAPTLADWLHLPGATDLLRSASVCLPFMAYGGVQIAVMAREMQFSRRVISDGGSALLGAAVAITLTALGYGAAGAITGVIVTSIGAPLLALLVGVRLRPRWSRENARETLAWAWVAGPGALIGLATLNIDYLVTARIAGDAATGVYALAYRVAFLPYVTVAIVIGGVAFPILAQLHREDRAESFRTSFLNFMGVSAVPIVGLCSFIFALADQVVLLGDKWGGSVVPLKILCLYCIFLSLNVVTLDAMRCVGLKGRYFWMQVLHLSLLAVTLVVLTSAAGIQGTSWAQAFSAFAVFAVSSTLIIRAVEIRLAVFLRALGVPVIAGAAVMALSLVAPRAEPSFLAAAGIGIAAVVVFVGVLAALDRPLLGRFVALVRRLRTRNRPAPRSLPDEELS